ncbi:SigE family RNA polymerase sigma factor [Nocardioides sp. CPCC 205120]|uniref:SigE family RNA polymerase sigma factor n=1 Tax=Nocardioides sp. CPCC 205120 TaxID=3406462 RepID=UPI003B50D055
MGKDRSSDDFAAFVDAVGPRLHNFATMIAADGHDGEDLLQTALERIWVRWQSRPPSEPYAYARQVVLNAQRSRMRLRLNKSEFPMDFADSVDESASKDVGLEWEDAALDRDVLRSSLRALSPHQRNVVVLRYLEDLAVADVAEILCCSVGSVKKNSHIGLQRLRVEIARAGVVAQDCEV